LTDVIPVNGLLPATLLFVMVAEVDVPRLIAVIDAIVGAAVKVIRVFSLYCPINV
jgi:hypothetical protein